MWMIGASTRPTARDATGHTAGERWATEQLSLLRESRFSPTAISGFLAASSRRARETRESRPALTRRSRRWTGAGAAIWLLLASLGVEPFRRRLATGLGSWAATGLMLDWHLGMFETTDGRARNLGPADALTLARAWLVPVLADALRPQFVAAAAASDVLDGVAARATAPTRAGRDLEGVVDGLAAAATLVGARRDDAISRPAAACEAARLLAALTYGTTAYLGRAAAPDPAVARASRATTPMRVGGLLLASRGLRRPGSALLAAGALLGIAASARSRFS